MLWPSWACPETWRCSGPRGDTEDGCSSWVEALCITSIWRMAVSRALVSLSSWLSSSPSLSVEDVGHLFSLYPLHLHLQLYLSSEHKIVKRTGPARYLPSSLWALTLSLNMAAQGRVSSRLGKTGNYLTWGQGRPLLLNRTQNVLEKKITLWLKNGFSEAFWKVDQEFRKALPTL